MKTKRNNRGFTLIELMVVITIIAILASIATPAFTTMNRNAKITKDSSNVRQIILACKSFGGDFDVYPSWNPFEEDDGGGEESSFGTSTEAFNVLIDGGYIDQESIFWYTTPAKNRPPKEDGKLEDKEVTYTYVVGQSDASYSRSPLVADGQASIGTYGEDHPWLIARKAVVGYCGGQVIAERLDSNQPGATVKTKQDNSEIFKKRSAEGEGGGLLEVDEENVLNPGGGD